MQVSGAGTMASSAASSLVRSLVSPSMMRASALNTTIAARSRPVSRFITSRNARVPASAAAILVRPVPVSSNMLVEASITSATSEARRVLSQRSERATGR
jgi:hypothetical protein